MKNKKKFLSSALAFATALSCTALSADPRLDVRPSAAHLKYHEREIIAIVHWGLNPYTGQEWGFGNVPVSKINAPDLNPAQWVKAIKAAEVKCIVFVAKHHDGFCLWPSKYNKTYSMAQAPAPNTNRDLVREVSDACRREGIEFGVYLSPWDRHQASYATPAYIDYFFAQWNEIMDNYGKISEIWLDGANGGTGWYGGANGGRGERRRIPRGYYRKNELIDLLRRKHPEAVVFGGDGANSTTWCGNEKGYSPETWWNPRKGSDGKLYWIPSEADFPLRRGWFYHRHQKPKSLAYLVKSYYETVGRGAVMNIGVAPDTRGLVSAEDLKRLAEFGDWVRDFNAVDYAKGAKVSETRDGNRLIVTLELPKETAANCIDIKEKIAKYGQRVEKFTVEIFNGNTWNLVSEGTTIGYRRLAQFRKRPFKKIRVILHGLARPEIFPVAIRCGKEIIDANVPNRDTYNKKGWKIVDASCKLTDNTYHAIDGNYETLWHTHPKKPGPQPPPQHFSVDCLKTIIMHGFDYIPRMDKCRHGMVDAYEFHISQDGRNWTKISEGEFGNIGANPVKQRITFSKPAEARYFRFTGTHSLGKNDHVALAEIDIW